MFQRTLPVTILLAVLSACSTNPPQTSTVAQGAKPLGCKPGKPQPKAQRTERGLTLTPLCGQDVINAGDLLDQAGFRVGDPKEFRVDDAAPDAPGLLWVRYPLGKKPKSTTEGWTGVPFDAVVVWDAGMKYRLLGLVDANLPIRDENESAGDVIDKVRGRKRSYVDNWTSDSHLFFSHLGGPLLSSDAQKDLVEQARYIISYLLPKRTPFSSIVDRPLISYQQFKPDVCASARFMVRSGWADPLAEYLEDIVVSLFGEKESPEAQALLKGLADPESRCQPAFTGQFQAGVALVAQRQQQKADAERLEAERQQRLKEESDLLEARNRLALQESYRRQAENFALNGRPFTALALLGWSAAEFGKDMPVIAPPSRDVTLVKGLSTEDLGEAIRGELVRQYWVRLDLADDAGQEEGFWPYGQFKPSVSRGIKATLTWQPPAVAMEKGSRQESWWTEGEAMPDREAQARYQEQLGKRQGEAAPLLERLDAIDQRLARIEERLQGPKLEIRSGGRQSEVSRMQEVCEPVPGGPPRCVNKWTTFSADGPMRSNGGLSPFEEGDLKKERQGLTRERQELSARLSGMSRDYQQAAADKPGVKRRKILNSRTVETYSYQAEGQVGVKAVLNGKPWESFSVSFRFEKAADFELREGWIADTLRGLAFARSREELAARWAAREQQRVRQGFDDIADPGARERERTLALLYLSGVSDSRAFISQSQEAIQAEGIRILCWTNTDGCFNRPGNTP